MDSQYGLMSAIKGAGGISGRPGTAQIILTAVRKGGFQKEIVTQNLTTRGLLGWYQYPKSVVRKIAVAWP